MNKGTSSRTSAHRSEPAPRDLSPASPDQHGLLFEDDDEAQGSKWTENQRAILRALCFDGYDTIEIADIMSVPRADVILQIIRDHEAIKIINNAAGNAIKRSAADRRRDDLKEQNSESFRDLIGRAINAASADNSSYVPVLKAIRAGRQVVLAPTEQAIEAARVAANQASDERLGRVIHPGALLSQSLDEGASIAELAHQIGVTRQALYALLKEQVGLSARMALKLQERGFIDSAETWLGFQAAYDLAELRVKPPVRPRRPHRPAPS